MNLTPRSIAESASFNAFMNAYVREIDTGKWFTGEPVATHKFGEQPTTWFVELALPAIQQSLKLSVSYRSQVGRHTFTKVYIRGTGDKTEWKKADKFHCLIAVIQNIYRDKQNKALVDTADLDTLKSQEIELLTRLYDSYQLMAYYIDRRKHDANLQTLSFLPSEQSILYGHWLHPTPKSRQGMAFWQQDHYSPELQGHFKLHYFSVDQRLVTQGSILSKSAAKLIFEDANKYKDSKYKELKLNKNHVLIPQHPLQAQHLLLNKEVQSLMNDGHLRYLGEQGITFNPTSSVRTVYSENSPWMYKFSIPVKITNSLRINMRNELENGMEVEKYLREVGFFEARPQFRMIDDPAYITINFPNKPNKESGFEVVLRRNIFYGKASKKVSSILALVQDPAKVENNVLQDSLLKKQIYQLAEKEQRSVSVVAQDWFTRYFKCAIESLIILYDSYGIALESHQQNSLLDLSEGYPSIYYYRDNQGFYLSKRYADTLYSIDNNLTMSEIFYEDEKIFEAMAHYVFFNQLFSVIHRLGVDELIPEKQLVTQVRLRLTQLKKTLVGIGQSFIDYMLNEEYIACKTNLLARVNDVDELHQGVETSIYKPIANPLFSVTPTELTPITEKNNSGEVISHVI